MIREEQQNCLHPFGDPDLRMSNLSVRILQAYVYDVCPACGKLREIISDDSVRNKMNPHIFIYLTCGKSGCANTPRNAKFPISNTTGCNSGGSHRVAKENSLLFIPARIFPTRSLSTVRYKFNIHTVKADRPGCALTSEGLPRK